MNTAATQNLSFSSATLGGVASGAQALVLSELARQKTAPVIHIAHHDRDMEQLREGLAFFAPEIPVLCFPAWDCLPYDRASPATAIMALRIACLSKLAGGSLPERFIILTTASAFIQRVAPRAAMRQAGFVIEQGKSLNLDALTLFLAHCGYRRASKVMEPGEFAIRGSIVDIFPGDSDAVRIDLFGDEVETIAILDPLTQRSGETLPRLPLFAASEVLLNEESIARFREGYRALFGAASREDTLYAAISAGQHHPGMEHWLPLFYAHVETLLDYLPNATITCEHQVEQTLAEREEMTRDYYQARKSRLAEKRLKDEPPYNPLPPEKLYTSVDKLLSGRDYTSGRAEHGASGKQLWNVLHFSPFTESNGSDAGFRQGSALHAAQGFSGHPVEKLAEECGIALNAGRNVLLTCMSNGSAERLKKMLAEQSRAATSVERWHDKHAYPQPGIFITTLPLERGFRGESLSVFTEQDIFGARLSRPVRKKKATEVFMLEASAFEPGELLVHREHGIARFDGLVTVEAAGGKHDCLKLVYKDEDKLFLPVENLELVSRYGTNDGTVELDKLGAGGWQNRKSKMKEKLRMAAEELMKIAAARAMKTAKELSPPTGQYDEFCARFPYSETEDQQKAIDEVLEDLGKGTPMDRLVCGDVGFGKTEVAIRAAYAAVSDVDNPVQVALIVPTTLLARQHYRSFAARFEGTGFKVAQLSRLVSSKDAKLTREGLADGSVHIVIGTHALLSKQVQFKNLGLLIIDEEQHFGVKQKEALKALKADVHVLTLSATPIPRTLQLALTGVRELSLITTPPVDRLAVRSFVMPYDGVVIREAIEREIHRGGQIFYVTPRIADIAELKQRIAELVPSARMAVAHGQLAPTELEDIMNGFYDGQYDILLSTAIIESGLDIPTANTIIINRADRFGLAQLYQMRGRVGRGKTRAYAYFTTSHYRQITGDAIRRLEVMQSLDALGAGFTLASHDMDIRGAGNLVGEEQSGHIKEVGIELYQQMLTETIEALKSQGAESAPSQDDWSPQINLGMSVLIPETYVEDLSLRLSLYRRLSALKTAEEIEDFRMELTDRFGEIPQEVEHLLAVLTIKQECKTAGISRIDTGPKGAIISFRNDTFSNPEALIGFIARHSATMKIRPDQKIFCAQSYSGEADRLAQVKQLVGQIMGLA